MQTQQPGGASAASGGTVLKRILVVNRKMPPTCLASRPHHWLTWVRGRRNHRIRGAAGRTRPEAYRTATASKRPCKAASSQRTGHDAPLRPGPPHRERIGVGERPNCPFHDSPGDGPVPAQYQVSLASNETKIRSAPRDFHQPTPTPASSNSGSPSLFSPIRQLAQAFPSSSSRGSPSMYQGWRYTVPGSLSRMVEEGTEPGSAEVKRRDALQERQATPAPGTRRTARCDSHPSR